MGIVRYEPVDIYELTFGVDDLGQQSTTKTLKFHGMATVSDVKNSVNITERYRVYSDLTQLKFNYTPWMKDVVDNQNLYSLTYRNLDWRIAGAIETDNRMNVILMCYRNDPVVTV